MEPKSYADQVREIPQSSPRGFYMREARDIVDDAAQIASCADEAVKTLHTNLGFALEALIQANRIIDTLQSDVNKAYERGREVGFSVGYDEGRQSCYDDAEV